MGISVWPYNCCSWLSLLQLPSCSWRYKIAVLRPCTATFREQRRKRSQFNTFAMAARLAATACNGVASQRRLSLFCMCVCVCCFFFPDQVAARRGFVDDIIDPALTRKVVCQDLQILREKPPKMLPKKHSNIPL